MPRERTFWLVLASLVVVGVAAGSFGRRTEIVPLTLAPGAPSPRAQESQSRTWEETGFERVAVVPAEKVGMATLLRLGPEGSAYVLDSGHARVLRLSPDGRILATYGDPSLGSPTDVAAGPGGEVRVCDLDHDSIAVFSPSGRLVRRIELDPPVGRLAPSPGGGFVATGIAGGPGLFRRYRGNGEPAGEFGALFPEELQTSIAADGWIVPAPEGIFYAFRNAGLLVSYAWDGRLRFFRQTLDPAPLPKVKIDTAGRQSVPDAVAVALGSSVVGEDWFVFNGDRTLDVYDAKTGSYRRSLHPPERDARYLLLIEDRLYSASRRGVTVWKPRKPG
jgi:hypothetical protein